MTRGRGTIQAMIARIPHVPVAPPGMRELPSDDGQPMETPRHVRQMNLLRESLDLAWRDRSD